MMTMDSNHSVHSLDEQKVQLGERKKKKKRKFSANGEDGIFNRLNKTKRGEELGE